MSLVSTIGEELKVAMKSGNAFKRDTLRFLQSILKNTAIEFRKPVSELSDTEVQSVVKRLVKQRKDSIEQYQAVGRQDLVQKEKAELSLIETYLPTALSREEIEKLVDETIAELPGVTAKDMGRVMGVVMKKTAGAADGNLVREIVSAKLK